MDGVWVEKQRFDILLMGRKEFRKAYEIDVNHAKFGFSQLVPGQRYLTREVNDRLPFPLIVVVWGSSEPRLLTSSVIAWST